MNREKKESNPVSKVFTRILGIPVGCKVGFLDFHNVPKYGTVIESDGGLLRIRYYRNGIRFCVVRYESEVELIEERV